MNKKCMAKIGTITLASALIITLVLLTSIVLARNQQQTQYSLGEKIKIEVGTTSEYTLTIKTPTQTSIKKSKKPYFVYQPLQEGFYKIKIESNEIKKTIEFRVIPAPVTKSSKINIPIEKIKVEQITKSGTNFNSKKPNQNNIRLKPNQVVRVGFPVTWTKNIQPGKDIQIKIPEQSINISFSKQNKQTKFKVKKTIRDRISNLIKKQKQKSLIIQEVTKETKLTYQTPAPIKTEENITKTNKKVTISSPENLHYTNVIAYTQLEETLSINQKDLIKIYWEEENKTLPFKAYDKNNNGLIDYIEWIVPHLSTQNFNISINVLNVQSYPIVGGTWSVKFDTLGTANLTIRAINQTSFGDAFPDDLKFLELRCANKIVNYTIQGGEIFSPNYTCNETGQETSLVMTEGKHYLEFQFGDALSYAQNDASNYTPQSCSEYWGFDCGTMNPEAGDNTFDTCANSAGTSNDEHVDNIYINGTNFYPGDAIGVTCEFDPYSTATEEYIYLYNGTWTQLYSGNAPGSTPYNKSITLTAFQTTGNYWIRCIADYDGTGTECASGSWFDNDDLSFNIVMPSGPPLPAPKINTSDGSNYPTQNLNCFDTLIDPEGDSINVSIKWYKEGALSLSTNYNNNYANGTFFNDILLSSNTSESENWMCSMQLTDGTNSSSWVNSSNIFITSAFTNYTPQSCSGFWGFDCGTGPVETGGDNTFDSCANGIGADESVENIYINATHIKQGDSIKVTCEFDPYTSSDYTYIWYYNGATWRNLFNHTNWGSSSITNESISFIPDDIEGTHWVRCGIIYNQAGDIDECMDTGSYYDNDDISFNVSLLPYPPTTPTPQINSTAGTNLTTSNLNCFDTISDPNGDSMNATVRWYKNNTLTLTQNFLNSYSSPTSFNAVLQSSNLSGADIWHCSMQLTDGLINSSWANSSTIQITDPGKPPQITIISPKNQAYLNSTIDLNVSTDKPTSTCLYSLNSGANITITKINNTFFSDKITLATQEHTLEVYCNDTYNQFNSTSVSFIISPPQYSRIAEFGKISNLQSSWTTINFNKSFNAPPVVIHRVDYNYNYDALPCQTRIRNVNETSFQIRTEAWSTTACPTTGVDATWLAMEKGVHNISNKGTPIRKVEATSFNLDYTACQVGGSAWTNSLNQRTFQTQWNFQPLVLASVQTANDNDTITHYIKGCAGATTTWDTSCVEIGMSGMENTGAYQPCTLHTSDETAGYIAWEMDASWTNSESRDNTGISSNDNGAYSWEAYWESDNVAGSANDQYPMSSYSITLSQIYSEGTAFSSGIRIDGADGLMPTSHFSAPSNQIFLLSEEDRFGDTDQSHTSEPFEVLFFNASSGFLYSENLVPAIKIISPTNASKYATPIIDFEIALTIPGDTCHYTLDEITNQTMTKQSSSSFTYTANNISDGYHNVTFHCNDTFGWDYNTKATYFSVDTTPLIITSIIPTSSSYETPYLDLNVTTSKPTQTCLYSLDGTTNKSISKINDTLFSNLQETFSGGEHLLEVYCNDSFGNKGYQNTSFLISITQYETIGEWGVVKNIPPAVWNTVYFNTTFNNTPIVVHQIDYGYNYDNNPCTTRVRAITKNSFQIRTDSWSETASCPSTGIDGYWLAVEKGIHNVSNAGIPVREIEATNFTMDINACGSGANPVDWTYSQNQRQFKNSWSAQPLVLSAVQSANDVDPISQYMHGCTTTESNTWNTTCIEIGLNGMENDGTIQPCNMHTQNEEGGYIAWEMNASWSDAETRDNTGTSGDGVTGYSWEAYWESDNVEGSDNDPYPMSDYFITLSQSYNEGVALGSGIRIDGANGVFPTVNYNAPSNRVYLLSDEDQFGDAEQSHTPEPYEILFFNSTTGFLFSENILNMIKVIAPINNTVYATSSIDFQVSSVIDSDSCWFSLDGTANTTMNKADSKNFDYTQNGLSDTTHSVIFYCNNTYGGEYSTEQYIFSVDSSPLIVTAIEPLSQSYATSSLNFSVNTSKPVTSCLYSLDGQTNMSMTQINSTYFTTSKDYIREGSHDVDYTCSAGVGGLNSTSVAFSVNLAIQENISRGSAMLPTGSSEINISFPTQDISKAFLKFSFRSSSSGPSQIQVLGELMSDKINFRRYSTTGDVYIEWTVIESPDLYVQRGNLPYVTGQAADAFTIQPINLTESFTTISNRLNTGTTSQNTQGFWSAKFDSSTQISASRGAIGTSGEAHWQAIEWDGSHVQSGYISGTGTTTPQALTNTINITRSFLTFSRQIAGQTSLQENFIRGYITDQNNIGFYKNTGSANHGISWYLVENSRFTVQNGLTTVSGTTLELLNKIELNSSFAIETHTSTGGGTTFANAFITNKIFNTTEIQFQKGTGSQTQDTNWFVISLGEAPVDFITIISPKSQTYSTTTLDFNVSLSKAASWCAYSLDETANQTMTALNITYFYNTESGLTSTTHNVTFYCNDTFGTIYKSNLITFDIDMSAPTVTSLSPANQTTNYTNTLYFSYNTTDNTGVSSCSLIANKQIIWTDNSITMDTTQFFEPYLDNGIYTWHINCTDGGGLTSNSESRIINVSGPSVYTWTNRFYETSTSDFTSMANIELAASRDATENTLSMTLPASSVTTVTTAKTSYLGNGGAIIPANTIIDFSAYTTVARNNFGYLTWKLYVENASGDFPICQSGDDFTAGTRMSSAAATWAGTCNSPAYDWVLKKSDRIKMILNVYNSDTSTLDFTHTWDDLKLSYVNFMTFTPLGALSTDLTFPTSNISIARETTTTTTCQVSCSVGSCLNTNAYIQTYNGTNWLSIDASGGIILNESETNPHSLGSVSTSQTTNFTLKGNVASFNDIRCMATSTYSDTTGTIIKQIEVQDSNMPPLIKLTSPATAYFFNTSQITLFYNASDENNNIINTTLILNGQINQSNSSLIINNQINNFIITLPDGKYNWTVNATDSYLATGTDLTIRNFTIDTSFPKITLYNPIVDESLGSVSVNFNFTTLDNMDSNLTCNLILDNTVIESGFSSLNATSTNLTKTVGLGNHLWNISCQDDAGNINFSETRNFTVSDTPPIVQPVTADSIWFSTSNLNLTYNVTDNGEITNCSLYLNGVFNQSNSTPIIQRTTLEFSLTGISTGVYNWSTSCQDNAGLIGYTPNQIFYVDTTAPIINLNLPINSYTSSSADINFNFTTTDSLDENLTCILIIDDTNATLPFNATNNTLANNLITDLTDGVHTWNANCTDEVGNQGTGTQRTITIEEYPTLTLDTPDNSWFFPDLELKYTSTDNTNFSSCSLIINGVTNRTNSTPVISGTQNIFTVDNFDDGIYNWSINCTDTYGLTVSSETRKAYRDSAPPIVNLSTPLSGENVFSGNVEFNWTATDALAQNLTCNITVDSVITESNINIINNTLTSNTTSISPGQHFWNVTCWDIVGNLGNSQTWNFTNFEAPSVSLDFPENNTWINNSLPTLKYNIFDSDDNLVNCSLYIDGTFNQSNSTIINNGAINNFTLPLSEGYHNWTVECIDYTGLIGTDDYRNINIDIQNPSIILNSPSQSEVLDWNNITFNFSTLDNLDTNLNCTLIIDAFPEVQNINTSNNTDTLIYVMRSDGNYEWQVQCFDEAGNSNTTSIQNFTVDAPPRVILHSPANKTRTQDANFVFNYTPEDAAGLIQCELYIDNILNKTETTIFPNQPNTFNVNGISEGKHNWSISCLDADSNTGSSNLSILYRDITPPTIQLNAPQDSLGINANNNVLFNWTTIDILDPLLTCDLVVDGITKDSSFATSGFPRIESISGLSIGQHFWNVTCVDQAGNSNISETRKFNYTYPDFLINQTSISISNDNPTENESITINATVYNIGGATSSVQVKFYNGDPETIGVQIGTTQTILIRALGLNTTSINWDAPLGSSKIYAIADYPNTTIELNETNNKANSTISVESWHYFYGDINPDTNFTLTDSSNYELTNWNLKNLTKANIYVADYDSNINWLSLQAIGKKTSGADSTNDIQEIDTALSMTAFKDSHVALYLNSTLQINETQNYVVFAKQINEVPVTTSINSSNFKTGILWDTSDDTNSEYDTIEKEDIVYITKVNKNKQGSYEMTDYELRVPANLRDYNPANSQTAVFYIEII